MQFHSRLVWTLKVSTVPSNQLVTPSKASEDPLVKVDRDGYEWDKVNSKEHGKLAIPMTIKLWQQKKELV